MKRTFFVSYITHQLSFEDSIVNTTVTLEEEQKANAQTFKDIINARNANNPHPFNDFHCSKIIAWSLIEF